MTVSVAVVADAGGTPTLPVYDRDGSFSNIAMRDDVVNVFMPKPKSKAYTRIRAEVIRLVALIPHGKFTTYGSIAVHMNVVALHVGTVLASLTKEESATLPWHRVVSSDARISPKIGARLSQLQRKRLDAEGMRIDRKGFIQDADAHFHVVGIRRNIRWSEG